MCQRSWQQARHYLTKPFRMLLLDNQKRNGLSPRRLLLCNLFSCVTAEFFDILFMKIGKCMLVAQYRHLGMSEAHGFVWAFVLFSFPSENLHICTLTLILRRSRTGTVWFYTSTSNKRAARPKLYTESLTRDLKRMYSRLTLVRISINL